MTTDILCVAAGLGASYAAEHFQTRYYEAQSVSDAIEIARRNQYRYVLLDADRETRAELDAKNIDYAVIASCRYLEFVWVERWLKAGSSVATIKSRLARWAANLGDDIYEEPKMPVAFIGTNQWLGEMLEQSPADKTDKEDV